MLWIACHRLYINNIYPLWFLYVDSHRPCINICYRTQSTFVEFHSRMTEHVIPVELLSCFTTWAIIAVIRISSALAVPYRYHISQITHQIPTAVVYELKVNILYHSMKPHNQLNSTTNISHNKGHNAAQAQLDNIFYLHVFTVTGQQSSIFSTSLYMTCPWQCHWKVYLNDHYISTKTTTTTKASPRTQTAKLQQLITAN